MELSETWARHADDLEVLAVGPRCAADEVAISWDDVEAFRSGRGHVTGAAGPLLGSVTSARTVRLTRHGQVVPGYSVGRAAPGGPVPGGPGRAVPLRRPGPDALERFRARRLDMLSLLALGPAFQMLLAGSVAAAWSDGGARAGDRPSHRPALDAALTGRLSPAAADWLGMDPDQVDASLHEGPGWGSVEVTGHGAARRLRAHLPAGWLASVWACGLAVTGGHLVVAVDRAAWPEATVRALPTPGAEPVTLSLRASVAGTGPGPTDAYSAHWEITEEP